MKFGEWMKSKSACVAAQQTHGKQTSQEAWDSCKNGDWMLWVAERKFSEPGWPDHIAMVKIAYTVARRVEHLAGPGAKAANDAAEKWANNPTEENRAAARAAGDAAWAAAGDAAGDAARAAARDAAWAAENEAQANIIRAIWPKVGG